MIKIFDTHAHYDDEAFDSDRDELIKSLPEKNVYAAVNIGVNLETSKRADEYTKIYDHMYGTVGYHPSDAQRIKKEDGDVISKLKDIALNNKKIVAIGEIGLDYHYEDTDKLVQKEWFEKQIELAREINLPISVHSRDAAKDTIDIMKSMHCGEIGGVIHCYSYSVESAKDYLNMGYFFGIGGVVTFKNGKKLKEVVEYLPMDRIVIETDSPYLTPDPFRRLRNDSTYLTYVAEEIARLKNISVDQVYETTWNNALKLYGLA